MLPLCVRFAGISEVQHEYAALTLDIDRTHLPGENEFRDTVNEALEEKGRVRLVLTRLIDDHLGHSSTSGKLIRACQAEAKGHA